MMTFIGVVLGAIVGLGAGYFIRQSLVAKKVGSAEARAEKILDEAKTREKELLLEAKTRSLEIIDQAKKQESEFRSQIVRFEERIDRKEKELDQTTTQSRHTPRRLHCSTLAMQRLDLTLSQFQILSQNLLHSHRR